MYSLDSRLYETNHLYKKGQKVKLDKCISAGDGDNILFYYRVAKTHEYLLWGGTGYWADTYEESTYSHDNLNIRQHMDTGDFFPGKDGKRNLFMIYTYELFTSVLLRMC